MIKHGVIAGALSIVVLALPGSAAERLAVPDFSGIWAHLSYPDVEPPVSGPGPVTNRSRLSTQFCGQPPCAAIAGSSPNGVSNIYEFVGDYTNPILKPEAAEVVKRHGEISMAGIPYPTPNNQCWPGGVPFVFWNLGMQMLQQKDEVTILYSDDSEVRHVRMNAQHPARITPSWYGDAVGHYEGMTLVIDTVGIKVGPFAMVDMYGTPHTEALHVVERYRILDSQAANEAEDRGEKENFRLQVVDSGLARNPDRSSPGLQMEFMVEDPGVFTTPWSAAIVYRRPLGSWPSMVCAENSIDFLGRPISLPHADRPDF